MLTPISGVGGLAWWGQDAAYGNPAGGEWSHGGFMQGVRTHAYLFPPANGVDHWRGSIILTNGEESYAEIDIALRKLLQVSLI